MGNYVSCTLTHQDGKFSRATKVIFPNNEIRRFREPIKAAEVMMESPNSFIVHSKSLRVGARFSALNADEDLEFASVYVMFPMNKVNAVITTADLGFLFITAKKIDDRRICIENVPTPLKSRLEDTEEMSSLEFKHRISTCRSKKPLLDTIVEEQVCSRWWKPCCY
ncbi:Protein of unknown function DUF4228 [Cynara cardunculus var. scolymus]|uniref:Uncharacterized protein n=1 Tax=Cynara cardunculus var. scolymus TaxID=59895 RepID=A0A103Y598_CYNCS|nr:Protein of unknown function DUF4228 [Cynara cardunculus var. scolymus]